VFGYADAMISIRCGCHPPARTPCDPGRHGFGRRV